MVKKQTSPALFPQGWRLILKGGCTMVNSTKLKEELLKELAFTQEDLEELERARNMPITFDEDCPETTPERALKFRRVNPPRQHHQMNNA